MSDLIVTPPAPGASPFDRIRSLRADGSEFWSARDLHGLMGYTRWERFRDALARAETDARALGVCVENEFHRSEKYIESGRGVRRAIEDIHLSRRACYLVAMSCDTAQGSAARLYFAAQTRRAELAATPAPALHIRPWSERIDDTWHDYNRRIKARHGPLAWSVFTITPLAMLAVEDEAARQGLVVSGARLFDLSVGLCWANYRADKPWAGPRWNVEPLRLPHHDVEVRPWVYTNDERPHFIAWFDDEYGPAKLPAYLARFAESRGDARPLLTADAACRRLTGRPLAIEGTQARLLAAHQQGRRLGQG